MYSKLDIESVKALAEQGNAGAQYEYGWRYFCDDSREENCRLALTWFRRAAEQGHPKGLWRVGANFEMLDDTEAVSWYRKSAEAGYPVAQWWLGVKYQRGEGLAKDNEQALCWYKKAAEGNDAAACRELGAMFENGEGVEQDWKQAANWYKAASARYYDLWLKLELANYPKAAN